MKHKQFFAGVLFTLVVLLAFGTGKAYAAGCFTDTNNAAACWLKNNGIAVPYSDGSFKPTNYLRRIDAAVFLYRANLVPPRAGDFHFSQALNSITPNSNFPNGSVEYYSDLALLRASVTGTHYYQAYVTFPTSMYGRAVSLKGVQICYNASFGAASLTRVEMGLYSVDSTTGTVGLSNSVVDTTTRTDKTCRVYYLTTPAKLAGDNHITVVFAVNFTSTSSATGKVSINSVTAILSPSLSNSTLDAMDTPGDVMDMDPASRSDWGK